jgi:hypothetical protein
MIAPQNVEPGIGDIMNNGHMIWYAEVEEGLEVNETISQLDEYLVHTSYSNVPPIPEGSTTSMDILAHRYHVVVVANSYIDLLQEVTVRIPAQTGDALANNQVQYYYFGNKMSAACIGAYAIDTNTDPLVNVTHAHYEWDLMYNSIPDVVKESDPDYATSKNS